jgi:uncharacterized membrane protein YvlD (DUF360 family)
MTLFLLKLLARVFVFGVALTYAVRRSSDVRVEPRNMLPVVAAVFTALNTVLYSLLSGALNLGTLWMFFFVVPFVANAILLLITDRILKPFKIESMSALARTAGIVTVAYFILKLAHL